MTCDDARRRQADALPLSHIDRDKLAEEFVAIIGRALEMITIQAAENIGLEVDQPLWKDRNNITRKIDSAVHNFCAALFKNTLKNKFKTPNVQVIGEESEDGKQLQPSYWEQFDLVVSLDALDGTDLAVRGLGNWCTAAFVFAPRDRHIMASFVGIPPGVVYYACDTYAEARKKNTAEHPSKFKEAVTVSLRQSARLPMEVESASVSFYGQKPENFLSIFENPGLMRKIREIESAMKEHETAFRVYNLGGNPMMINLAEGNVDAVIELIGQKLYDVIPGMYIATKAGAFLGDLAGAEITAECLKAPLSDPQGATLNYILASTPPLYRQLQACVSSRPG